MKKRSAFKKNKLAWVAVLFLLVLSWNYASAQSKPWIAPASAQDFRNPETANANAVKEGKTLYTTYCTPCHGDKGKGDGPAAAALNPKPADHTSAMILAESDGSIFYKISEGRTPMPQYKATLTEAQRWDLVAYIRTLNKASAKK